jgi:hypothetical protein
MAEKTIIIVHGIGEQLPGKTIDDFVGGLEAVVPGLRASRIETGGYQLSHEQNHVSVRVKEASWASAAKYPYIWNVFWFFFRACQGSFARINLQYPFAASYQFFLALVILLASITLLTLWLIPLLLDYLLSFGEAENLAAAVFSGTFSGSLTAALISYVYTSVNNYASDDAFSDYFLLFATGIIPLFILISMKTQKNTRREQQADRPASWLINMVNGVLGWITPPVVYFFRTSFDWAKTYLTRMSKSVHMSIVKVLGDIEIYVEDIDTARRIKQIVRQLLRECPFGDDVHLVGHSLGSVILYETLCDLTEEGDQQLANVKTITTVGSPLNRVRYFWGERRRFNREFPRHIRWYNYDSVGDFIGSYLTQFPERDIKNIRVANTIWPLPLWSHVEYWRNNFLMKDMWSRILDAESLQPLPEENKWIGQAILHWSVYGVLLVGLYLLGMMFVHKEWAKGFGILLPALLVVYAIWASASRKLTEKAPPPSDPWTEELVAAKANLAKSPEDPELRKAVSEAEHRYQLRRRTRRKTKVTSWGIIPAIVLATAGWLWMRMFLCWDSGVGPWLGLFCSSSAVIPMLIGVGGTVLLLLFIFRDLPALGMEVAPRETYRHRIKAGYENLEEPNRKSVRRVYGVFATLLMGMVLLMVGLSLFLSFHLFPF